MSSNDHLATVVITRPALGDLVTRLLRPARTNNFGKRIRWAKDHPSDTIRHQSGAVRQLSWSTEVSIFDKPIPENIFGRVPVVRPAVIRMCALGDCQKLIPTGV